MTDRIALGLLNDFDIVVHGLAQMLAPVADIVVVDTSVGNTTIDQRVDVALFDTFGRHGLPWAEIDEVVANSLATHVAVFTFSFSKQLVDEALTHGVAGYLWKGSSSEELADSIRKIAAGKRVVDDPGRQLKADAAPGAIHRWPFAELGLSARESEVLALMVEGLSNPAIADALYISRETVKSHVKRVLRKLGVSSRLEAATFAVRDPSFARQVRRLAVRNAVQDDHQSGHATVG